MRLITQLTVMAIIVWLGAILVRDVNAALAHAATLLSAYTAKLQSRTG